MVCASFYRRGVVVPTVPCGGDVTNVCFLSKVTPLVRYGLPVLFRWPSHAIIVLVLVLLVSLLSTCVLTSDQDDYFRSKGEGEFVSVLNRDRYVHFGVLRLRFRRVSFEGRLFVHLVFVVRLNVGKGRVLFRHL